MDWPQPTFDCFTADEFEMAGARDPGHIGVELIAQARPNGRIIDHYKLVVGGDQLIEFTLPVSRFFEVQLPEWHLAFSFWPRDIPIRRNMASSEWEDIRDVVQAGEVRLTDKEGAFLSYSSLADALDPASSSSKTQKISSSFRWMISVGSDGRPELHMQLLPVPASVLAGKPIFKRYYCNYFTMLLKYMSNNQNPNGLRKNRKTAGPVTKIQQQTVTVIITMNNKITYTIILSYYIDFHITSKLHQTPISIKLF